MAGSNSWRLPGTLRAAGVPEGTAVLGAGGKWRNDALCFDRMSVPYLKAVRYVVPLREGGSLPAIVDGDNGEQYVLKFRGAGQGAKAIVAELIAAGLATALGLPVPPYAVLELEKGFGEAEPDPEIQDLLRGSIGLNFGLGYLPGGVGL